MYILYSTGQLSRAASQNAGILTISEATSGDSGLYDCVARDAEGQEIFESARVSVDAFEALPTAAITPERFLISVFFLIHKLLTKLHNHKKIWF